jgi:hypothetical protein
MFSRIRRVASVIAVLSAACRRSPAENSDPHALLQRYPLRPHVEWTEWSDRAGAVSARAREEVWTQIGKSDAWDVITRDRASDKPPYHARYALTKDGLVQTAIFDGPNEIPVIPPKLTLPTDPTPGKKWEAEHSIGRSAVKRSCNLIAYDKCKQGIDEHCRSVYEDGRIVEVHNRWCAGVGQVSYASVTRTVGSDTVIRIWSEDLVDVAPPPR